MAERHIIDPIPAYIAVGQVVEVLAGARWYNVRIGAEMPIPCAAGSSVGSHSALGPSKLGLYAPGTFVLISVNVDSTRDETSGRITSTLSPPGYIICSVPGPVGTNKLRVCDWIAPFTGADAANDLVHSYAPEVYQNQHSDYNINLPFDCFPSSFINPSSDPGKQSKGRLML